MGYDFKEQRDIERVGEATLYVEKVLKNAPPARGNRPSGYLNGWWGRLMENGQNGKYSWIAVEMLANGTSQLNPEWGYGDYRNNEGFACESLWFSKYCLIGDIVWIEPTRTQGYYLFDYKPGFRLAKLKASGTSQTATIPKRSGLTPGYGDVTPYWYNYQTNTFVDSQLTVRAYNWTSKDIKKDSESGIGEYLRINFTEGVWWVESADCVEEEGSGSQNQPSS